MSPEQLALVLESHARISPAMTGLARSVHDRLAADPDVDALLPSDREALATNVGAELDRLIGMLGDLPALRAEASTLGASHRGYGVTARHYTAFGSALSAALAEQMGDDFPRELEEAWHLAFVLVSQVMLEGASHAPRADATS